MKMTARRSQLAYFALGGTIASVAAHGEGALVKLKGSDLLYQLPTVRDWADVDIFSFREVPSGDLVMDDILDLVGHIRSCIRDGAEGVVISQGTDTLEETAYLLDLLIEEDVPVILTGAMRNATLPGADGAANLLSALQVAASGITVGLGAVVVLNDEIHAARFVRKRHTSSTATFGSPLAGPIGYVSEGDPKLLLRPCGRLIVRLPDSPPSVRVGLVPIGFDEDGAGLTAAVSGLDGVVLAAYGGGHVPARLSPILEDINRRIPIVLASRTFAGPMLSQTYAFEGAEIDLLRRGLISAGAMDAVRARILLRVLLMGGVSRSIVATTFQQALSHDGALILDARKG